MAFGVVVCLLILGGIGWCLIPSWRQKMIKVYLDSMKWMRQQYHEKQSKKRSENVVKKDYKKVEKKKHGR